MRGAFIVIEGLDRSGKSTQVGLLEERLKSEGIPVRLAKFPGKQTAYDSFICSLHVRTHVRPLLL